MSIKRILISSLLILSFILSPFSSGVFAADNNSEETINKYFIIENEKIISITEEGKKYISEFKQVTIPDSIKEICSHIFEGMNIESVTLNEGLIKIGDYAFADNKIQTLDIPKSLEYIGEYTFANNLIKSVECSAIKDVMPTAFKGNPIKNTAFDNENKEKIEDEKMNAEENKAILQDKPDNHIKNEDISEETITINENIEEETLELSENYLPESNAITSSEEFYGTITVKITNPSNPSLVYEGVRIDLYDSEGILIESKFTDLNSSVFFYNLKPGKYSITRESIVDFVQSDYDVTISRNDTDKVVEIKLKNGEIPQTGDSKFILLIIFFSSMFLIAFFFRKNNFRGDEYV